MMELTLNRYALEWIDANRKDMSRQAFVRTLLYELIDNATSGGGNNEGKTLYADGNNDNNRPNVRK